MIIDFHTHTFPDEIAERTIAHLTKVGGIKPFRDGTLGSLKESMRKAGIDQSIVLPVATNPRQEKTINQLSAKLSGKEGIIFAGAIHPDCESVEETLDYIKNAGLFGIKLHPDYQGVEFDDPRYLKIISEAAKRDLIVVTHAGVDVAFPSGCWKFWEAKSKTSLCLRIWAATSCPMNRSKSWSASRFIWTPRRF